MIFWFNACDASVTVFFRFQTIGADRIDSIGINGHQVVVTVIYETPTPCWYYCKTESTNDDGVFTSKVFGKDDGDPCIDVIGSFKHKELITFLSPGKKTLRFWRNDSTYLDTTITIR